MTSSALQKTDWRGRIIRYAPLILWIGLIMFFSSGQASMSKTSIFVRPLLEFLFSGAPEEILIVYHGYVRKLAHVTVYAILAFWTCRAFSTSAQNFLRQFWFVKALLLVFLVAAIDETNQSFINSRTGSISDVLLDSSSGLAMILIFLFVAKWRGSEKN